VISTRTHAVHKRWNREKWRDIIGWLHNMGYQTIQVGQKERKVGATYNLSDKTNMNQLMAICARSAFYVGIDAGVSHVAVGCGTPAVVLFGPARPSMVAHEGMTYAIEAKGCHSCRTADKIGRKCPIKTQECMYNITVEQVQDAVSKVIREHGHGFVRKIA
ncbi:MAG: glycosyltransferase family 9 protein, partial [Candidatus Ranarchaeia archaeon]